MNKPQTIAPFKHFCLSIGVIPSAYTEAMTYYELLEWLDFIIAEKKHAELFIGNKQDYWDPHADMLNCLIGSIVFTILFFIIRKKFQNTTDLIVKNE